MTDFPGADSRSPRPSGEKLTVTDADHNAAAIPEKCRRYRQACDQIAFVFKSLKRDVRASRYLPVEIDNVMAPLGPVPSALQSDFPPLSSRQWRSSGSLGSSIVLTHQRIRYTPTKSAALRIRGAAIQRPRGLPCWTISPSRIDCDRIRHGKASLWSMCHRHSGDAQTME